MATKPLALPARLAERLRQPLPGLARCAEFAPELCYGRHEGPPAHNAKHAAVLILLYQCGFDWRLPLILRPITMPSHAGQVSLPGGEIEEGESIEEAAIRECQEELGVSGKQTQLLGRLTATYVFASNFVVTPCVAWTRERPAFVPNPDEVANLLEPRLVDLRNTEHRGSHIIERRGMTFRAPYIVYDNHRIWGATSMILAELLAVAQDCEATAGT